MPSPIIVNPVLEKIRSGKVTNVFCAGHLATPRLIDFIAGSGKFDAIWFDLEHFAIPTPDLAILCMIARGHGVGTVARAKASDYQEVLRILETGVNGLMCAMVSGAQEARQIVEWARFHNPNPQPGEATGRRGWNGGNIDARYGNIPPADYIRQQNTETFLLAQIEHESALAEAEAIARTPGIDGLFFGPGDYAASLGLAGQLSHPRVNEALEKIAQAAATAGIWWGTLAVTPEMQLRARGLGASFLSPGGDVKVMNLGLRELTKIFEDLPGNRVEDLQRAS
jgi:2-keto-3-deoxy-L-rhamnonate aldolase RhmA